MKEDQPLMVCWTQKGWKRIRLSGPVGEIVSVTGGRVPSQGEHLRLGPSPKYVFFRDKTSPEEIAVFSEARTSG
jgi:hypothetical protein